MKGERQNRYIDLSPLSVSLYNDYDDCDSSKQFKTSSKTLACTTT